MRKSPLLVIAVAITMTACATVPTGPSVMALPGSGKSFEQFQADDALCRQWASQQAGTTGQQAATDSTVSGAAIGTVLGAAVGALLGAAGHSPGTGAAIGAGVGLIGGTAVGASRGAEAETSLQRRYDHAYTQCMYAKGHGVPGPRGAQPAYSSRPAYRSQPAPPPPPPPPAASATEVIPPPPPGPPPPPPPGPSR